MDYATKLKAARVSCAIIATPKETGSSCGVCVKVFAPHFNNALRVFRMQRYITFHSFFIARYDGKGNYNFERLNIYFN